MESEELDLDLREVIDGVKSQLDDEELDIAERAIVEGSRVALRKAGGEDVEVDGGGVAGHGHEAVISKGPSRQLRGHGRRSGSRLRCRLPT